MNITKKILQARLASDIAEKQELVKSEGKNEKGQFIQGHTYAQKYPPKVAENIFNRIWEKVTEDEGTGEPNLDNPVRANTIKLLKEACLCVGISYHAYMRIKAVYCTPTDLKGDLNPLFNEAIAELCKKIEEVCEMRLIYSGQIMDIFVLKNHYGYVDKVELAMSLEQTITVFTLPDGTKLPI